MVIGKSHNINKEQFIDKMNERGVNVRPFFYPLSMLPPFYDENLKFKNVNSYDVSDRGVNLPGSAILRDEDMIFISDKIKEVLR
jgi:perosamine synthetase